MILADRILKAIGKELGEEYFKVVITVVVLYMFSGLIKNFGIYLDFAFTYRNTRNLGEFSGIWASRGKFRKFARCFGSS